MPKRYFTKEEIEQARQVNLYEYLTVTRPGELKRVSANEYRLPEHDSLRIKPDGRWYWWSRCTGGRTALDYLVKVEGMAFTEAAGMLLGGGARFVHSTAPPDKRAEQGGGERSPFTLPKRHRDNARVIRYLESRAVDREVIDACVDAGILYQMADRGNAVFLGLDDEGKPAYAALRGSFTDFRGEAGGSDKKYGFVIDNGSEQAVVCESAIDAMSVASYLKAKRRDWRSYDYLSLGGVTKQTEGLPPALEHYLERREGSTKKLLLCFDADEAGRKAALYLRGALAGSYLVDPVEPQCGKDWNEYVVSLKSKTAAMERG